MKETINPSTTRDRGFIALMLLTAGMLVLVARAAPFVGDTLALVLGVELLVWARVSRAEGPLVAGGVLTGIGTGIVLIAGALEDAADEIIGATFLFATAAGFAIVAMLTQLWLHRRRLWTWITAGSVAMVAGAVLAGTHVLATWIEWGVPTGLITGGILAALRWRASVGAKKLVRAARFARHRG